MSRDIAIVGAEGTLGRIASEGLEERGYEVTRIDRELDGDQGLEIDFSEIGEESGRAREAVSGCDAIVNYAWDAANENFTVKSHSPVNREIAENVYELAHLEDIPLVVQASSIHAAALPAHASLAGGSGIEDLLERTEEPYRTVIEERKPEPEETVSVDRVQPDSPYGATKAAIEASGRYHSDPDIQNPDTTHYDEPLESVVAVRYGGVNPDDSVEPFLDEEPLYDTIWMSHGDLVRQLEAVIESDPEGFHRVYGLSDNDGNPYSLRNPFGFRPEDNAAERIS